MSMLWRNWLAFVAVLATILSILATLSVLQYDSILTRLIQERLAVVAETAASSFRPVINLGLPISTVRNAENLLASAQAIDSAVSGIKVFHPTGIVVHTTPQEDRDPIPEDVLLLQSLSSGDRWTAENATELLTGVTLRNRANKPIGGILVSASNDRFEIKSHAMAIRIAIAAGITFAVFSILALLILRLRLNGAIRGLGKLERISAKFSSDSPRQNGTPDTGGPGKLDAGAVQFGFLSGEIVRLENLLAQAYENFGIARQQLERLVPSPPKSASTESVPVSGSVLASVPETALARIFARHMTPWALVIILGSALTLGMFVHQEVTKSFEPELAARTKVIGTVANNNIQRAINAGVPLTNLVGAETYFGELLEHFPEVSYFGIATGRIVYEAGTRQKFAFAPERSRKDLTTFPITDNGEQIGYIIIDANPEYFALQFRDTLLDFGVVILVVLLLAFQIMTVVMSRSLTAPFMRLQHLAGLQAANDFSKVIAASGATAIDRLSQKLSQHALELHRLFAAALSHLSIDQARTALKDVQDQFRLRRSGPDRLLFSYLNDVRLPLFLFAAADELPLAFFPIFTRAADNPLSWLDPGVVISLPLAGYLVAIVFGSPLARPLAERFGHRKLLLMAILPTMLAHLGLYFATDVIQIVVFRTITGLGYAIVALCCQDYVLDVVPGKDRNRSLGLFTAAMFSGIFAGAALGGVLADRLGQHEVFAVSAGLVLVSGYLTYRLLPARAAGELVWKKGLSGYLPPIWQPLHSRQFAALVFGIAVPANILLQAFISFLVVLQLNALGASAADTGRILMTYFLAIVFVGPAVPHLFGGRLGPAPVGLLGAVLSAISLGVYVLWPAQWSMLIAVAGAGIAHGMVRDSQVAVAMEIAENDLAHLGTNTVLGSLRTLERLSSMIGLILVAFLSSHIGNVNATALIAGLILIGAGAFAWAFFGAGVSSPSQRPEGN
ncbi:MAG: MFS transporter [Pseudomonadota bacterium]